ncbi:MAG: hypothetical protein ABSC92_08500 [Rhizomicrobium sp.]
MSNGTAAAAFVVLQRRGGGMSPAHGSYWDQLFEIAVSFGRSARRKKPLACYKDNVASKLQRA